MKQLTIGDIEEKIEYFKKIRPNGYKNTRVFLGDDDELNGIHCGWYVNNIRKGKDDEDEKDIVDMIEERCGNLEDGEVILLLS